jgi:hypothetical protein
MAGKSRFTRLDAFAKTVEDARVRTTSGGVVTLASLLIIFWLVWGEWADYRRVVVLPELIVDKSRGIMKMHQNNAWLMANTMAQFSFRGENGDSFEHDLPQIAM